MSVKLMGTVWELDIPSTDKLVLLAFADWADDNGKCWPSIAKLRAKCGLSERGVQTIIQRLKKGGHLKRDEVPGKGVNYTVAPRTTCTPAQDAPPQEMPKTPATRAPKTTVHVKGSEAKASSPKRAAKPNHFPKPDWADEQVWSDFMENRRTKKLPNTETAYKGFLDDITRISNDEWPPGRLLKYATGKGWGGIYEPKDQGNGRQQQQGNSTSHPSGKTGAALERVLARYDRQDEARGRSIVPFAGTG